MKMVKLKEWPKVADTDVLTYSEFPIITYSVEYKGFYFDTTEPYKHNSHWGTVYYRTMKTDV